MKKVGKEDRLLFLFVALFAFSITMIVIQNMQKTQITGYATEGSTVSNVTISYYYSIGMHPNLQEGIMFGTINTLPAANVNATHNYDGALDGTTFIINVSSDSNTDVDFCIKANNNLYDSAGGNTLGITNETYSNSTSSDLDNPALSDETGLTTAYTKTISNVSSGGLVFYRFWLDVPLGTPSGTYNNTVHFKAVVINQVCGS
jgi:hypothetical protein